MEIKELFESKSFVKGGITYQPPRQILQPIVDKLSRICNNFDIKTSEKVINANEDESANIAYGRVLFQTDFNNEVIDGMYKNIGVVYGLDGQKPLIKIYTGTQVKACTNLCVFQAEHMEVYNLSEGLSKPYNAIDRYITGLEKVMQDYLEIKFKLVNTIYSKSDVNQILGGLLEYGIKNKYLGINAITNAAQSLYDNSSKYFFTEETNAFNVYNAVTQHITDKADIIDKAGKTLLLSKYFLN